MSRFREELRVIPFRAVTVAVITVLIVAVAAGVFLLQNIVNVRDPWPVFMLIPAVLLVVFFGVYVLLIGYVYGDARRRGMRYVVWTLLAIFIPNCIGIILYFLLRDPLQHPCPSCGALYKPGMAYCPNCGVPVGRVCPQCNRPAEEGWKNCAYCGRALAA